MKSNIYPIIILLLVSNVLAGIDSINYPAPNEIISESSRIQLDVTSTASTGCYFNYDNVRNQSINCNGISLVNLPTADGTYTINVGDDAGNGISQQVTVIKPSGVLATTIYIFVVLVLVSLFFMVFYLIARVATYEMNFYDLAFSYCLLFLFFLSYQLFIEHINTPFMLSWLDLFLTVFGWLMTVGSTIAFVVCMIIRSTKKKDSLGVKELNGRMPRW